MLGYRNPKTLADASAILSDLPNWRPVFGCTDVLVQLRAGRIKPAGLVNLWDLLPRHIEDCKDEIRLGAGVTCTELTKSSIIQKYLKPLWSAASTMGSPLIRNRASLGGNIANASPAADMVSALIVEGTEVLVHTPSGEQVFALEKMFLGPGKTVLKPGAIITGLKVPKPPKNSYARFDKLGFRQAQVIAAVNFSIRAQGSQNSLESLRIAWGSVAPKPVRSHAVEGILLGAALTPASIHEATLALDADIAPISDHRASAQYRKLVAAGFLRRALKECQTWLSA